MERLEDQSRSPVLDPSVLADLQILQDHDGQPLLNELVRRYEADLPQRLANLQHAFDKHDLLALQKSAHALRSCSLTLGAVGVSKAAEPIEHMRALDEATFSKAMSEVGRAAASGLAALRSHTRNY